MSADKEKLRERRAVDEHFICKRGKFATFFNVGYSTGNGVFRKRKPFACSCRMCRRMDYHEHVYRHRQPALLRQADSLRTSLLEIE